MKVSSIEKFLTAGSKVRVTVMLKDTNNRAESSEMAMKLMQEIRDQVRYIAVCRLRCTRAPIMSIWHSRLLAHVCPSSRWRQSS